MSEAKINMAEPESTDTSQPSKGSSADPNSELMQTVNSEMTDIENSSHDLSAIGTATVELSGSMGEGPNEAPEATVRSHLESSRQDAEDSINEDNEASSRPDTAKSEGSSARSESEGSSSGSSCSNARAMERILVDSDTGSGSSSVSPRDGATSEASSEDPLAELEAARQTAGSVMSDVSSYSWMRESTMGSVMSVDPDSALGRIREDLARENQNESQSQALSGDESRGMVQSVELTNELTEGPTLTLPPVTSSAMSDVRPTEETIMDAQSDSQADSNASSVTMTETSEPSNISSPEQIKTSPTQLRTTAGDTLATESTQTQTPGQDSSQSAVPVNSATDQSIMTTGKSDQSKVEPASTTPGPVSNAPVSAPNASAAEAKPRMKRTPNDFIFGKVIGEGSYSTVYLAKEVSTQKEYAIKICEKKHLIRERKTHFVKREKEVFLKLNHPFFVRLAYTFQDAERLYYVITYARNGELLNYLHKLSVFDVPCTRFYTAEIALALEYLHGLGIIHRDLKPENILLSEDMHIKITDFGTSKILQLDENGQPANGADTKKKNSFVGTAEYVSPEVLNNEPANYGSDLWALGCIIYQCLSGCVPFRSGNEYQTFQKIVKAEFTFPEGFNQDATDLVSKLLVLEPEQRLGMSATGGMSALKSHQFYAGVDWERLPTSTAPKLMPYLPATSHNPEFWGQEQRVGFDDQRLAEIITGHSTDGSLSPELEEVPVRGASPRVGAGETSREERLEKQRRENQFHQYVEGNLILKQGFVDKRKGLFARKRMLLLTEGPHLYYVDAHHKILKGEIPWSKFLRPEAKNFKIFFVHTPNRTYYLESRMPDAQMWVKKIQEVWRKYYGNTEEEHS